MKKIYLLLLLIFHFCVVRSQPPCLISLDSIYLDTALSNCNHLFFKYKVSGGNPSSYSWTYGDGNSCACVKPKNVYSSNGNFQVCGIVKDMNACPDTLCITVNVNCSNPCDLSGIGIYSIDSLSYSCNEMEFITITSSNAKKIKWDFGDGDSSDTKYTLHTFAKNGQYNVRLIIQDSIACADTAELGVNINCPEVKKCNFQILSLDTLTGINCKTKHFELSCNALPVKVTWLFGDSSTVIGQIHIEHFYFDTGMYKVCAIAEDSFQCLDTFCLWMPVKCPKKSSIHFESLTDLQIYPIPFTEKLNLTIYQDGHLTLFNPELKEVFSCELKSGTSFIELSELRPGMYILLLEQENSLRYYKVIKQ